MAPTEHRVFISYATQDRLAADRVCGALERAGVTCWIAARDIEPGTIFPATIVEALNTAEVLPWRLSSADLTGEMEYYLSLTQWLDAPEGCTDESLKRLTDATLECLTGKTPSPLATKVRRRGWLVAGSVAALLAAGGATYWMQRGGKAAPPQPRTWLNPADGQTYVWIPPGTFTMGCSPGDDQCRDNEGPVRQVRIENGFWLGQTEVTATRGHLGGSQEILRRGRRPIADGSGVGVRRSGRQHPGPLRSSTRDRPVRRRDAF